MKMAGLCQTEGFHSITSDKKINSLAETLYIERLQKFLA